MSTSAPAEPPPLSARRQQTRDRLLDAAYQILAEHGIAGASIEAVCEAAGFTRGAFYSNFDSKTELFLALTEREQRRRLAQLESDAVAVAAESRAHGRSLDTQLVGEVIAALLSGQPDDRQWRLISNEFELLALRQPEEAARFLQFEEQILVELTDVVERLATSLGLRLVIPAIDATRLFMAGYAASTRQAYLLGPDDHGATARELAARWLPAVVERLIEPLED